MKNVVALVLAGGQGTRLYELTQKMAKPAVEYGGKYRIIDFVLSNCSHSYISNVGVVTQYEPMLLNKYVNNGKTWNLDFDDGGLQILPPFVTSDDKNWFTGTAHAIYANREYIEASECEYVLILSGDHIYSMNYSDLVSYHIEKDSDLTICVKPVDIKEASRFGIMNTDATNKIIEFQEKPENPISNLASMGIYVFKKEVLMKYLDAENEVKDTNFDFGENIIPHIISDEKDVFAYEFEGYWKDVGTIDSLWEANMDLLQIPELISNPAWPIYSHTPHLMSAIFTKSACISNSIINEGSQISGEITNSVVSYNCLIDEDVVIKESVINSNVVIHKGCKIEYAIVKSGSVIKKNSKIIGTKDNIILVANDGGKNE